MFLITGGSGQLGGEIRRICEERDLPYRAPDSTEWDITDRAAGEKIFREHKPAVLFNCAAYTAVDKAELEIDRARAVNRDAVEILGELCVRFECGLIHVSTDYVFSGWKNPPAPWRPEDPISPLGVYARTKADGEEVLRAATPAVGLRPAIVRTGWVYSTKGPNFPLVVLAKAQNREQELRVVEDQIGRPTSASSLAMFLVEQIWPLVREKKNETIYHYCNSGVASRYDLAQAILELGQEYRLIPGQTRVLPVPSSAYPSALMRPPYSVLCLEKSRELCVIPHWREELRKLFDSLINEA